MRNNENSFTNSLQFLLLIGIIMAFTGFSSCEFVTRSEENTYKDWDSLRVTASAYNSLRYQTGSGDPRVAAWGDTLEPGMKAIAVSRDLIRKGLKHNTPVKIEGLEGLYYVKDKMHHRWKNKIDIYMGEDVQKAKRWGRKKLKIRYPGANAATE